MTTSILNNIVQFAVITADADGTVKQIQDALNLGPFKVWDFTFPALFDTTVNGKSEQWTMKLAFGWIGDMQIEVIQPTTQNSLYSKYLNIYGRPGIQHLFIDRAGMSYADKKKQLETQGGLIIGNEAKSNVAIQMGLLTLPPLPMFLAKNASTTFAYTDSFDTLKLSLEVSMYPPGIQPRQGIRMGVPSYWSDGNKQNFETLPIDSLITGVNSFKILVKSIADTLPHYQKLCHDRLEVKEETMRDSLTGSVISFKSSKMELSASTLELIEPLVPSAYSNILDRRGEGCRIITATVRDTSADTVIENFKKKNFSLAAQTTRELLFDNDEFPFAVQVLI